MHSVLIVFQTPVPIPGAIPMPTREWVKFVIDTQTLATQDAQVQILAENTLLILLQNGLSSLAKLVCTADALGLKYRALFLDQEPE
jgi:hypothetical protein